MIDRLIRSALLVLAAALPLTIGACGRVPGQFEILNDQIPSPDMCTVPIVPTAYQGTGTLDVSIVRGDFDSAYFFFPLLENNLPRSSNGNIDPNEIQLSSFDIDITPLNATGLSPQVAAVFQAAQGTPQVHYQTPWSGGISSGGGQLSAIVPTRQPLQMSMGKSNGSEVMLVPLFVVPRAWTCRFTVIDGPLPTPPLASRFCASATGNAGTIALSCPPPDEIPPDQGVW
jgi:hypothetical protein